MRNRLLTLWDSFDKKFSSAFLHRFDYLLHFTFYVIEDFSNKKVNLITVESKDCDGLDIWKDCQMTGQQK